MIFSSFGSPKLKLPAAVSFIFFILMIGTIHVTGFAQTATASIGATDVKIQEIVFKTIDTVNLKLRVYALPRSKRSRKSPAIVYYFGGGWNTKNPLQFHEHALRLAEKGMVAILADYRVKIVNGTSPMESLLDAKSAMRYVRSHARELRIDSDRIAASGGSAGGHLAAACYTNDRFNDTGDDQRVSAKPNALVLFNPVIDNGPDGYGYDRVKEWFPDFSPMHMITKGFPQTIFFIGTKDYLIPVATAETFRDKIIAVGSGCELHVYDGAGHGFFNQANYRSLVLPKVDAFLQRIGYIR
jgi:acetyl esterase/lipase